MLEISRALIVRENIRLPEQLTFNPDLVGFQARLLLGLTYLNPDKTVNYTNSELNTRLENYREVIENTYVIVEKHSLQERKDYWAQRVQSGDTENHNLQRDKWQHEMVNAFHQQPNRANVSKLARLKIGVGDQEIHFNNFTFEESSKLYQRYFGRSDNPTIQLFIKDIVDNYTHAQNDQNRSQGQEFLIDQNRLLQDMDAIQWFSQIFGNNYSYEIITQMIFAELNARNQQLRNSFLMKVLQSETVNEQPVSRINQLFAREKQLLNRLFLTSQTDTHDTDRRVDNDRSQNNENDLTQRRTNDSNHLQNNERTQIFHEIYTSDFTKEIADSLRRCGIKVEYVNPTPIGQGANHIVYMYQEPGYRKRVVKIGKPTSVTTMTEGPEEEKRNFEIASENFPEFVAQTDVITDPQNSNFYCVIQDAVNGQSLTNKYVRNRPEIKRQLENIIRLNNDLYRRERMSLDFVGMPGFKAWLNRQKYKFILRKSEFEVSNILVDENGRLKIVDYEFFYPHHDESFSKRFKGFFGLFVNRILMKHYFGVDIKR